MIFCSKKVKPKRIHISENRFFLLDEDVYTKNLDRNAKKANITYKKGFNADSSMTHTPTPKEGIKTDKMDASGSDTYIVPLKNGINSYNITDINGQEIMHYFKRLFSGKETNISVKIGKSKEDYKVEMQQNEVNNFLQQFVNKINFVVCDYVSKHKELTNRKIYKVSQVCVYPVKSSSNFNTKMVNMIIDSNQSIFGLPVVKLNEGLLKKDISNIQKDEEFLSRNAEYYKKRRGVFNVPGDSEGEKLLKGQQTQTHMNGLNSDLNMFKARQALNKEIERLNSEVERMLNDLDQYRKMKKVGDNRSARNFAMDIISIFPDYCRKSLNREIIKFAEYTDDMGNVIRKRNDDPFATPEEKASGDNLKYYREKKGTDEKKVINDTNEIIELLRIYNPSEYKALSRNFKKNTSYLKAARVVYREPVDFQIKKIFNDSRMGLKNLFSFDLEELEKAKKQIEGNILVIFDDNVSGGATLSDICAQFLNIGVKHIIPITFGKMFQQWGGRDGKAWAAINEPENGFVFADRKTFVFNGKTFSTDQITSPMDCANLYKEAFKTYDKQGAIDLWNTYKNVKEGNSNATIYKLRDKYDTEPLRMAADSVQSTPTPTPVAKKEKIDISKPLSNQEKQITRSNLLKDIGNLNVKISNLDKKIKAHPLSPDRAANEKELDSLKNKREQLRAEVNRLTSSYSQVSTPVSQNQQPSKYVSQKPSDNATASPIRHYSEDELKKIHRTRKVSSEEIDNVIASLENDIKRFNVPIKSFLRGDFGNYTYEQQKALFKKYWDRVKWLKKFEIKRNKM